MVRIHDVAKHAGVSVKTVSRVINNEQHVKPHMREKVIASIKELEYIPSSSARNLRSRRTYALHLITHTLDSSFTNGIQSGALMKCQSSGYKLLLTLLEEEILEYPGKLDDWCASFIKKSRPDGIILVSPYSESPTLNYILKKHKLPLIRIGPNDIEDNHTTISINDKRAAQEATQHLLENGHRRIAFVKGSDNQHASIKRYRGYQAALANAGIEIEPSIIFEGTFRFDDGMRVGEKIVKMENRPTAVFASNDDMAAGLVGAFHKNQLRVPEDISVMGFDDSEIACRMWPELTTIRQPRTEYGRLAVEILISRANQSDNSNTSPIRLLEHELIARKSTAPYQEPDKT